MRDQLPCPKWRRGARQGRFILCRVCGWKKAEHPTFPVYRQRNKHNARAVIHDGIRFASGAEGTRYLQLKAFAAVGEITALEVHPTYDLRVGIALIGRYTPDFRYCVSNGPPGWTVEEVKGVRTEAYALRVKLFRALYPMLPFIELDAKTLRPRKSRARRG